MRQLLCLLTTILILGGGQSLVTAQDAADLRWNILWISCEDISPNFGCYGDSYATTPTLDRLASQGARFDQAFTPAGVCAVVRSGVITGMYPVSIGSQHMRSRIVPPPEVKCFTEYLRAAGYFCTNRSKTDYQFESPQTAWDRQGNGHRDWDERAKGQPFFSVINLTGTHESQIRHPQKRHDQILASLPPEMRHDPANAGETLPVYLPNTEASRQDWAWYHDNISALDMQVKGILDRLERDGLSDSTVVFVWGDHGMGMPRGKRWIYDSGTRIPFLVRWPGKIEAGTVRDDLTTAIDLAPTMLSIAGVDIPDYMHGRVLVGDQQQEEPDYLFFHRDRMDEAYELMRGIRDRKFKYLRNYEPEKTYAQGIDYMDEMPTMRDWRRLAAQGKLNDVQARWFATPKPIEELYDLENDPYEIHNLAELPEYQDRLATMRNRLEQWQVEVRDLGMVPEPVLMQRMKPGGKTGRASEPIATVKPSDGEFEIRLMSSTPGASLTYRVNQGPWQLYHKPITSDGTEKIEAKACRLGMRDSSFLTVKFNSP